MNEGILNLTVTTPFRKPMSIAMIKVETKAIVGGTPALLMVARRKADIPKTEPTERSKSPEIIKKDTPTAIVPNSAANVNIEVMDMGVKNFDEATVKAMQMRTRVTKAANSGTLTRLLPELLISPKSLTRFVCSITTLVATSLAIFRLS
jgi:hypothetical protein